MFKAQRSCFDASDAHCTSAQKGIAKGTGDFAVSGQTLERSDRSVIDHKTESSQHITKRAAGSLCWHGAAGGVLRPCSSSCRIHGCKKVPSSLDDCKEAFLKLLKRWVLFYPKTTSSMTACRECKSLFTLGPELHA